MAIQQYGDLFINGQVVAYEGAVKIEDGSITRVPNPQVNGQVIYTEDISTNRSKIMLTVRVNPENDALFDS